MRYKREEPFRYTFGVPIKAMFHIVKVGNRLVESSKAEADLIDISPEGAKLYSELDFPIEPFQLEIEFTLNGELFNFYGELKWKRPYATGYDYGIHFLVETDEKLSLIEEIKQYSKQKTKT